jgi:hypothetical protein
LTLKNTHTSTRYDGIPFSGRLRRPLYGRLAFAAVIVAVVCMAAPLRADNFVWIGAPSIFNSWSDQNNWMNGPGGTDPDGIPDGDDTATFNTNALTSGGTALNLSIAPTAVLSVTNGSVTVNGGTINNQHTLSFDAAGSISTTEDLYIVGTVTLNGAGEVQLVNANTRILDGGTGLLINVDNLIHGGNNAPINVPVTNQGTIRADNGVLYLNAPISNASGTVQIFSGATLYPSTITGGILACQAGSLLNSGTLDGVTTTGTTTIGPGAIYLNNVTNQGNITFDVAGASTTTEDIYIIGTVTLNGGGEVQLINANTRILDGGTGLLINVDNLIHGGNNAPINVPVTNQGTIRADNGVLYLNAPISNASGTVQIFSGATLYPSTITGGILACQAGSLLNSGTIDGVTTTGTTTIGPGAIYLNNVTNQGNITFDVAGASATTEDIYIIGTVTLNGGGEVQLINTNTRILDGGTGTLINVDNLIHGGNNAPINVPVTNQGTIRADNGVLYLNAPINNASGTVQIFSGATLYPSTITGGILACQAGSLLNSGTIDGVTTTGTTTIGPGAIYLNNVTNQGNITFDVTGASTTTEDIYIIGTVTLNGGGEVQLINTNTRILDGGTGTLINVDNLIHGGNNAPINVPVTNQGTIRADNGVLSLNAPIDSSSGTLQTQVAGLNAGESTLLHFGGSATLGGTLEVTFLNGFLPHTGDVFKPIQIDGTVSGDFAQITFRGVGPGFQVQGQFVGGFYQLTALNDATAAPLITSPTSATATLGQPFIYQIVSSPNAITYGASPLPAGLTINASNGIISGVPTAAGTTQITLSATNVGTGTAILTLTIQPPPPSGPVITSAMSSTGRTGQPFTFQVTTAGGSPATSLAAAGLPSGLTANPLTGLISGTTIVDGSFRVTLTVTDGPAMNTGTLQLTFTSDPAFPVIISSQSAALTPGQSFLYTIVAPGSSDPNDPTTFGLIGTLPQGLSFDAQTGTISGTFIGLFGLNGGTPNLSGGIVTNVQLFAENSHGTSVLPLIFFLAPTGTVNISTRLAVGTGDNVLIAGFIVTGNAPKKLIIRALGPSLPVPGALQDTILELHDGAPVLATNDDWRENQESQIIATAIAPTNNRESAIVSYLNPGNYTAIVRGKDNSAGIAIVEVYDLGTASLDPTSTAKLAQISTRGTVLGGDSAMIGGFIILGQTTRVIARAIGPSLSATVPGALQDTTLELHNGSGAVLASNDDWRSTQEEEIIETGVPPADNRESAIVATLSPGAYTGIVRGKNDTTGVALVEVYALQ